MNKTKTCPRVERGAIPTLILAMLLLLVFMTASLATDVARQARTGNELKRATDAAAIAGAGELMKAAPEACDRTFAETRAFNVLALSKVDGLSVSPTDPSTQLLPVEILLNTPTANHHQVRVKARRATHSLFTRFFTSTESVIESSSVAEVKQGIFTLPGSLGLPLAVDLTARGGNLYPLSAWAPGGAMHGQPFTIWIQSGGQDNAGWISGAVPGPTLYERDLSVGQTIFETNIKIDSQLDGIKVGGTYVVPITDNQFFGVPGAHQFNTPHKIAGWMAIEVTNVTDQSVTGRIVVPVAVPGKEGAIVPGSEPGFTSWSAPWTVSLKGNAG